ncbi:hypothetical protein Halru_1994 [Halovivax ruber XH-70]|uniref:Uncharacterized protein n=1 Tax=Halovivax ruber (strain DSM 18193 / JCM 13892 / XH-70) TaxID=797302 RepID=L0ICM8_HALRX|nr:hypothetical protein [Halovivax ruber]AGB16588.1 hypothetical protein Halru_1994 [Halovivax ruber XH-70]
MLTLDLDPFMVELKEGSIRNVGPTNKETTVKLFDVEDATAREFGDKRVKLAFTDGEGNEVEVALFPAEIESLQAAFDELVEESPVFE